MMTAELKLTDAILPCPFCGEAPKIEERPPCVSYDTAWVFVRCDRCGVRPMASGSRQVREWVGNDKPNLRYCTDEEGLVSAKADALRLWNRRAGKTQDLNREAWLNGCPRHQDTVIVGMGVCCVGCGRTYGITCVVIDGVPRSEPDWPFNEHDCPLCALHAKVYELRDDVENRDRLTVRLEAQRKRNEAKQKGQP